MEKIDVEEHLKIVRLDGTWREMGRQYGELLWRELRRTLEWANGCGNEASDSFFSPSGTLSGMDFMDDFMEGAAEGAGLSLADIVRANGVEVAYGAQLTDLLLKGGRCGTLMVDPSRTQNGGLMVCRNYDWLPSFAQLDLIVCVLEPEHEQAILSINFAGCFYLTTGMNGSGLFVELNAGAFASSAVYPARRQNAWELWTVLRGAETVAGGLEVLERIPAAECYLIGLGDGMRGALFEWSADGDSQSHWLDPAVGHLAFTNHFIRQGWCNLPLAWEGGGASSACRCQALASLARTLPERASVADLEALMAVDVSAGGASWSGTLFQVIAVPGEGRLLLRRRGSSAWHPVALGVL